MAFFPRKVGGRHLALSRWDRENNAIATSTDGCWWGNPRTLHVPSRPWELTQTGYCVSPVETDEGWLVLTHGVGPMRQYSRGALLLNLADPSRVIGALREPLTTPQDDECYGYVPDVIYSCGPCGTATCSCCPTEPVTPPCGSPSSTCRSSSSGWSRRAARDDAGEEPGVVRHQALRGEALLDIVPAVLTGQGADPSDRVDSAGDVVDQEPGAGRGGRSRASLPADGRSGAAGRRLHRPDD